MSLSAQVALTEAASEDEGSYQAIDFRERTWVPSLMVLVDIIAIEAALFFGYLARTALSLWRPIELAPSTYAGMIIGVLLRPLAYYLVGLHPGYGLGRVERLRRRLSVTVFVFVILIAWDNIAQVGAWSRGIMLATFGFALIVTPLCETLARAYLIRKRVWALPVLLVGTGETSPRGGLGRLPPAGFHGRDTTGAGRQTKNGILISSRYLCGYPRKKRPGRVLAHPAGPNHHHEPAKGASSHGQASL